jgi:hypothetical protein
MSPTKVANAEVSPHEVTIEKYGNCCKVGRIGFRQMPIIEIITGGVW